MIDTQAAKPTANPAGPIVKAARVVRATNGASIIAKCLMFNNVVSFRKTAVLCRAGWLSEPYLNAFRQDFSDRTEQCGRVNENCVPRPYFLLNLIEVLVCVDRVFSQFVYPPLNCEPDSCRGSLRDCSRRLFVFEREHCRHYSCLPNKEHC